MADIVRVLPPGRRPARRRRAGRAPDRRAVPRDHRPRRCGRARARLTRRLAVARRRQGHPEAADGEPEQHRAGPQQVPRPAPRSPARGRRDGRRRRRIHAAAPRAARRRWPTPCGATPGGTAGRRGGWPERAPGPARSAGRRRPGVRRPRRRPGRRGRRRCARGRGGGAPGHSGVGEVLGPDHADQRLRQVEVDVRVNARAARGPRAAATGSAPEARSRQGCGDGRRVRAVVLDGARGSRSAKSTSQRGDPGRVLERAVGRAPSRTARVVRR